MELLVVGLNHRTAPVTLRERVAVAADELPGALAALHAAPGVREVMLVSTCNRLEFICVPDGTVRRGATEALLEGFLSGRGELPRDTLRGALYELWGRDAVLHLMRTAASLDSLVVGEPQILGQVKAAFDAACAAGTVGTTLHLIMQRVFKTAKRVRTESGIGRSAVSVGSIAAELAHRIFSDLHTSDVALVGAGEMAEQAAQKLAESGARSVTVVNRNLERAERLAMEHGWRARPLVDLPEILAEADIVITSVGAREPIVDAPMAQKALGRRRYRPLFIVDIALPRNVEPAVGELERVYLYNIDDLDTVIAANLDRRQQAAARAEAWLAAEVDRFMADSRGLRVKPVIVALRERVQAIAEAEVERAAKRLSSLSGRDEEVLRRMTAALVSKLLHAPTTLLKEAARGNDADRTVDWVVRVFGLDDALCEEPRELQGDEVERDDEVDGDGAGGDAHEAASGTPGAPDGARPTTGADARSGDDRPCGGRATT